MAKLKESDKFGWDYTCYYSKRVQDVAAEPAPEKPKSKKKSRKDQE